MTPLMVLSTVLLTVFGGRQPVYLCSNGMIIHVKSAKHKIAEAVVELPETKKNQMRKLNNL